MIKKITPSDIQISFFDSSTIEKKVADSVTWRLYVDGASRGNPGLATCGIVAYKKDTLFCKEGYFLERMTNNRAEYMGLLAGIFLIKTHMQPQDILLIFSDSQLMVCQVQGLYKVKNEELKLLHSKVKSLLQDLNYSIEHVLREYNQEADAAANNAFITKKLLPSAFNDMMKDDKINY